jgi:DeoR/GlpR family transcriptional regulator of sugar metabolism
VVCGLEEIDTVVTDAGVTNAQRQMLKAAGVALVVAQ